MDCQKLKFDKESLSDLYNAYVSIESLIEELKKNIKELPSKEVM